MKKAKVNKLKQKKKYEEEEDEEENEEEENEYVEDGFLVNDDEDNMGRRYRPMNPEADPRAPEAEIDSEFTSDDYDIMDEKTKKKKGKKLKKGISQEVKTEIDPREKRRKHYSPADNEDLSNFIEPDNRHRSPVIRKGLKKSVAHNIFSLEEQEEIIEEKKLGGVPLSRIYDKEELEEEYATQKDNLIKLLDYPERLLRTYTEEQLLNFNKDVDLEADWILERMKTMISSAESIQSIKKKINLVLEYHRKEFLDVPFISTYKRMYIEPELTVKDVWKIFEMDKEWTKMIDYKSNVKKQFSHIVKFLDNKKAELMERRYIENARSIRELKDMEAFIAFMKELHKDEMEQDQIVLRPIKRSVLEQIKESKINEFAKKFSISAHELAINLELISSGDSLSKGRLISPPDPNYDPAGLAFKYITTSYDQELKVMTMACRYLSLEMLSHPYVRIYARNYFRLNCTLSTEPTEEGKKELDVFNPSYGVKRLRKKPIDSFNNDLFLDIIHCENKGLITVKIECEEDLKEVSEKINCAYNPENKNLDDGTQIQAKWRIMREEAIRMLVVENLFPEFIREVRSELSEKAESYVIQECCNHFQNLLVAGPYKKQRINEGTSDLFAEDDSPKVMSFVLDSSKNEVYCAMLDPNGELLDYQIYNHLTLKIGRSNNNTEKQIYYDEQTKLRESFEKYKPDLIVIGANDLKCKFIKDQISAAEPELIRSSDGSSRSVWVTYGDLSVPKVYANSRVAEKKFKNFNIFLKQAISLGRLKQNPLAEVLQVWHEDVSKNSCLSLPMHPLQKMINQNKLAEYLEMRAIEVVNNVGVDINQVYEHLHLRGPLNFVSGLGPRKAAYILQRMIAYEGLQMRLQMVASGLVGKRIFMNCAGFIKIKLNPNMNKDKFDFLDMTRIHPEAYPMANKLAKSAAEEASNENHVELCLRNPKNFNSLDLKEFIKRSEEKGTLNMKPTVQFIMSEFCNPFKDLRPPHKDLTPTELFYMLIGDENFKAGHIVLARVVKVDNQHVKCRLNNDLEATVWIKDIYEDDQSERNREQEMKDRFKEQTSFEARIKSINENTFKIDLSARPSVLATHKNFMQVNLDKCFVITEEDYINKSYQEEIKSEHKRYVPRTIKHPAFKNITFMQAIDFLRPKDIGDYIFRPSSKGINNITVSWKYYKSTYAHIDIAEEEKLPGAAIGSKLRISNDTYSSLDEILDRHLEPCKKMVRDVMTHRKFVHFDNTEELDRRLKDEKTRDPDIVHYLITILPDYPLYIILAYIPKPNVVTKEYIKVKTKGFFFHDDFFADADRLILWYKSNFGQDSYREYVKRIKPPCVDERRKPNDGLEFNSFDHGAPIDNFDSNRNMSFNNNFDNNSSGQNQNRDYNRGDNSNRNRNDGNRFMNNKRERSNERGETNSNSNKERRTENEGWDSKSRDKNNENANSSVATGNWGSDTNTTNWGNEMQVDSTSNANINKPATTSWGQSSEVATSWGNSDSTSGNQAWGKSDTNENKSSSWGNNDQRSSDRDNGRGRGGDRGRGRGDYRGDRNERSDNRNSNSTSNKPNNESSGWGNTQKESEPSWGQPQSTQMNVDSTWGNTNTATTTEKTSSGWGAQVQEEKKIESSGWGSSSNQESTSGWGASSNTDNNSAWGKSDNNNAQSSSAWGSSDNTSSNNLSNANNYFNKREGGSDSRRDGGYERRDGGSDRRDGGSDRRGGGDRENRKGCFNCGEDGHMSRDCPNHKKPRDTDRPKRACFNCGEEGHNKPDCPNPRKDNPDRPKRACFNCGEEGHNKQDCTNPRKDNPDRPKRACFNCGEEGHNKQDCTNPRKDNPDRPKRACFNCGEEGHNKQDCTNPRKDNPDRPKRACFNCGEEGHNKQDCTNPRKDNPDRPKRACFNCGEEGHNKQDCTNPRKDNPDRPKRACFNCGEEGHNKQDCTNPRNENLERPKRACFNCGDESHMSSNCPKPRDSSRGGRGRGGGDRGDRGDRNDFRSPRSDDNWKSPRSNDGWGTTNNESSNTNDGWGASSTSNKEAGGWGASSTSNNEAGGWGASSNSANTANNEAGGWGASSNTANTSNNDAGGWGASSNTANTANTASTGNAGNTGNAGWGSNTTSTNLDTNIQGSGGWGTTNTEPSKTNNQTESNTWGASTENNGWN